MPYIKPKSREQLDKLLNSLVAGIMKEAVEDTPSIHQSLRDRTKGIHNYVMFALVLKLVGRLGLRYSVLQDIVGTFECCKQEFIRRVVSPYEDGAIKRNGDIADIPTGE